MGRRIAVWVLAPFLLAQGGCFVAPDFNALEGAPAAPQDEDANLPYTGAPQTGPVSWPKYGTKTHGGWCATAPVIDGQFTGGIPANGQHEWACAGSAVGLYGRIYALFMGGTLYVANDWRLRSDAPICPGMYNEFWLNTQMGLFDIRVFEQNIEVTLQGQTYDSPSKTLPASKGAAGFGVSPDLDKPHAIFEFAIPLGDLAPDMPIVMTGADPCNNFVQYSGKSGTECPANAAAMVDEPTSLVMTAQPGVYPSGMKIKLGDERLLPLTGVEPWPLVRGQQATVRGAGLAAGQGAKVRLGGQVMETSAWLGNCVIFHVPQNAASKVDLVVERAGKTSQTLSVDVE